MYTKIHAIAFRTSWGNLLFQLPTKLKIIMYTKIHAIAYRASWGDKLIIQK